MDEYSYTVLYKKETIVENKSYFFSPCYVIKGLYDKETHLFLDELNKERFTYSDINIIGGDSTYCIGEIYTEEELSKKFPEAYGLEELLICLFKEAESSAIIGNYDKDSTSIKISKMKAEDSSDDFIFFEEGEETYNFNYDQLRKKFGCDVILLFPSHIESILSMKDMSKIKSFVKERIEKKKDYSDELTESGDMEQAVFVEEEVICSLLETDDIDNVKKEFQEVLHRMCQLDLEYQKEKEEEKEGEEGLTLDNILNIEEKMYRSILESADMEQLKEKLTDLNNFYYDLLETIKIYQEDGYSFQKTYLYFDSQTQFLNELIKKEDFLTVKENYTEFHQETRKYFNSLAEEWQEEERMESLEVLNEKIDETNQILGSLVGLENVKRTLEEMFATILFQKKTEEDLELKIGSKHMIFTGNPGTGKTTVANIIAPLLHQLGYLESDKVSFVASQDLIGQYAGHTAPKTQKVIQKNLGGLIVFDEAYILADEGQKFGNDAINVILKEMEKNRTMFIFCGYKKEMEPFIKMNSGLESRIGVFLEFPDYSEEELFEIFKYKIDKVNAKENKKHSLMITTDALEKVKFILKEAKKVENFGNGRFVDKLFDTICRKHAKNTRDTNMSKDLYTIVQEDIPDSIFDEILFSGVRRNTPYSNSEIGFHSAQKSFEKMYVKSYHSPNSGNK